jgi:hypothetical protein
MQPVLYTVVFLQRRTFCAEIAMTGEQNSKRAKGHP